MIPRLGSGNAVALRAYLVKSKRYASSASGTNVALPSTWAYWVSLKYGLQASITPHCTALPCTRHAMPTPQATAHHATPCLTTPHYTTPHYHTPHQTTPHHTTPHQGAARSCIDTVACHHEAMIAVACYHYLGNTLLSDDHVPLLFTIIHPVARLDKPSPHTVSCTPQYHLGPVALSPADTADFRASVLQRRDINPKLAPARWLKCLQRAIYDWAKAAGGSVHSISGTTASDRARRKGPPHQGPRRCRPWRAVCSPPWGDSPRQRPRAC